MKIRIAGFVNDSIVDGPGLRLAVFTQGCPHHCPGCHNSQALDFDGGNLMDTAFLLEKIKANPLLDGVTFSGGEPFVQPLPLLELGRAVKELGLNLWIYTGYTWEELAALGAAVQQLLALADVLVDGPYLATERSLDLKFRGSKNQRILDVQASLSADRPIALEF